MKIKTGGNGGIGTAMQRETICPHQKSRHIIVWLRDKLRPLINEKEKERLNKFGPHQDLQKHANWLNFLAKKYGIKCRRIISRSEHAVARSKYVKNIKIQEREIALRTLANVQNLRPLKPPSRRQEGT